MKRISIFAGLLLSIGSQELPAVTLRDTVGARQERATQDLIEASAGKDSADVYRSLKRSDRGDFLRRFWEARNPLLYRYYYAAYVSEGRIVVSHSFFDRGELYPRVYQSGLDQWPDSTIAKAENSIDSIARSDPADIAALTALGYLRLERDAFSEADDWFIRALRLNRRHGAAIVGRGLVGLRKHRQIPRAIRLFQRALATNPFDAAAHYAIAIAHLTSLVDRPDTHFHRVTQIDSLHEDAHYKLGVAHERAHRLTQALAAYRTQIAVNPNHQQAAARIPRIALGMQRGGLEPFSGEEVQRLAIGDPGTYLPLLADYHLGRGDWETGALFLDQYLARQQPEERWVYDRVDGILGKDETVPENRADTEGFWITRDPTPATPLNERRIEHHRRVHFARTHFADVTEPWDDRGYVLLRYGHPHAIHTSEGPVTEPDSTIRRFKKERWTDLRNRPGLIQEVEAKDLLAPIFPVERGHAWESWIYLDVSGGIEVTFVAPDEDGAYRLAPVSPDLRNRHVWNRISPATVVKEAILQSPDLLRPFHKETGINFSFTTSQFPTQSQLTETYLTVGVEQAGSYELEFIVYNDRWQVVVRKAAAIESDGEGETRVVPLVLHPDTFYLVLIVRDPVSGDEQFVKMDLPVRKFGEGQLEMTHLVLATDVTETMHDHASRLIQRSSYGVFSTPDQVFDIGQPVFLYYELYNLTRDPFGRTHYRLTYRVRRVDSIVPLDEPGRMRTRSGSVVDVSYRRLSGKGSGEEDTQFSYEHEGDSASESVYIALSEIAPPQPDVFQIEVTVTDLNADGRAVSSQIGFGME